MILIQCNYLVLLFQKEGVENYNSLKALVFLILVSKWGRSTLLIIVGSSWKQGIVRLEVEKKCLKLLLKSAKRAKNWEGAREVKSSRLQRHFRNRWAWFSHQIKLRNILQTQRNTSFKKSFFLFHQTVSETVS